MTSEHIRRCDKVTEERGENKKENGKGTEEKQRCWTSNFQLKQKQYLVFF